MWAGSRSQQGAQSSLQASATNSPRRGSRPGAAGADLLYRCARRAQGLLLERRVAATTLIRADASAPTAAGGANDVLQARPSSKPQAQAATWRPAGAVEHAHRRLSATLAFASSACGADGRPTVHDLLPSLARRRRKLQRAAACRSSYRRSSWPMRRSSGPPRVASRASRSSLAKLGVCRTCGVTRTKACRAIFDGGQRSRQRPGRTAADQATSTSRRRAHGAQKGGHLAGRQFQKEALIQVKPAGRATQSRDTSTVPRWHGDYLNVVTAQTPRDQQ